MTDKELLELTLKNIRERGWFQGDFAAFGNEGAQCIRGTAYFLDQYPPLSIEAVSYQHRLMRQLGFGTLQEMTEWNDGPNCTVEEVIARLETALARLEASPE